MDPVVNPSDAGDDRGPDRDEPAGPAAAADGPAARDEGGLLVLGAPAPEEPADGGPQEPAEGEPVCADCGAHFVDGYCGRCGARQPAPHDHVELAPAAWAAGVCDRGIRHARNEDALAVAVDAAPADGVRRAALVVSDGVSTARRSAEASQAAVQAAADELLGSRSRGLGVASALVGALSSRLDAAADAAAGAVRAVTEQDGPVEPSTVRSTNPSCTIVAAVVDGDVAVVGNVGDSRAYWVPDAGEPVQLTIDDSWAEEEVRMGVPRAEAEAGPRAHTITRWIGVDCPDHRPTKVVVPLTDPGWLILCSDGLWNYASEAQQLAGVLARGRASAGEAPLDLARFLVDWANAQGGRDNITVALLRAGAVPEAAPAADTLVLDAAAVRAAAGDTTPQFPSPRRDDPHPDHPPTEGRDRG